VEAVHRLPPDRAASSEQSIDAFAPIGCAAIATGTLVALGAIAFKVLTGVSVFLGDDQLVMVSAVLMQTGVILSGLALITNGPARTFTDGERKKERL